MIMAVSVDTDKKGGKRWIKRMRMYNVILLKSCDYIKNPVQTQPRTISTAGQRRNIYAQSLSQTTWEKKDNLNHFQICFHSMLLSALLAYL